MMAAKKTTEGCPRPKECEDAENTLKWLLAEANWRISGVKAGGILFRR
jgi:hypothetical protein